MKKLTFLSLAVAAFMVSCTPDSNKSGNQGGTSGEKKTNVYDVDKLVKDSCNNPELWMNHLTHDLMKFWKDKDVTEGQSIFFSTFRSNSGEFIPADTAQWPAEYKAAMQVADLKGLVEDATKYNYIRAHSRQTYAYGIAYNMTGNVEYLQLCRKGAIAILSAMDENNGLYNKQVITDGVWLDPADQRNSQDLAYGITGLGFYYYLTHDETVLKPLLNARKYIFDTYFDAGKDFLTWLPKHIKENNDNVEIVSQLDQLYAYMLWVAPSLPEPYKTEWKTDLKKLANVMINHFYSERYGTFWGSATNDRSKELGTDHTDFGHSVKAMWVIYEIGKITDDITYVNFAREKIKLILNRAYIKTDGTWARRYFPDGTLDKDKEWWGLAELDQAAALLSLNDPSYLRYTNTTYKYWFDYMIDKENGEIWHMVNAETNQPAPEYPKIHAWKTSLHSFEHCFLGYMISSYHRNQPFTLYYAFSENEPIEDGAVEPYFLRANILDTQKGETVTLDHKAMNKVGITFNYLH
ncbi:hypothetical protein [Phocaeicola sp.]